MAPILLSSLPLIADPTFVSLYEHGEFFYLFMRETPVESTQHVSPCAILVRILCEHDCPVATPIIHFHARANCRQFLLCCPVFEVESVVTTFHVARIVHLVSTWGLREGELCSARRYLCVSTCLYVHRMSYWSFSLPHINAGYILSRSKSLQSKCVSVCPFVCL